MLHDVNNLSDFVCFDLTFNEHDFETNAPTIDKAYAESALILILELHCIDNLQGTTVNLA